jgi:hypothetical protein
MAGTTYGRVALSYPARISSRQGRMMKNLVKTLSQSLMLSNVDSRAFVPYVYTTAIGYQGSLFEAISGITTLTRELGFTMDVETNYSDDGSSAMHHADHIDQTVSLAIECNALRQTVSLAVSGANSDDAFNLFEGVDKAIFGCC